MDDMAHLPTRKGLAAYGRDLGLGMAAWDRNSKPFLPSVVTIYDKRLQERLREGAGETEDRLTIQKRPLPLVVSVSVAGWWKRLGII